MVMEVAALLRIFLIWRDSMWISNGLKGEGRERGAEVLESKWWYLLLFLSREKGCASCILVIQGPPWWFGSTTEALVLIYL